MRLIEILNAGGDAWFGLMARAMIDTTLLLAVMLIIWLPVRRRVSAHLAHGLFCLVLLKLIVPIPVSWSWGQPMESARLTVERVAAWAWPTPSPVATATPAPIPPEPVVLPTTGDMGVSLSDVATPQPIAIAESKDSSAIAVDRSAMAGNPVRVSVSARAWLMLGWACGAAFLLARLVRGFAGTRRLMREALTLRPELLPIDVESLRLAVGVRVPVRWAVNFELHSPAVGGLVWPTVIIPPDLDESLTPKQLTWVLLHELAHIRRGDLWVVVVQRVVQAVFFFNPAVHLANWIIDELREYACDDAALAACKTSRRDCGQGFLAIVERAVERSPVAAPVLGLFESQMQIKRRLMRILDNRRTVHAGLSLRACFSLLVLAMIVLLCGRPGDLSAFANGRSPSRAGIATPAVTVKNPEGPTSYRPGTVWHREAQGRDRDGHPRISPGGRVVVLATAYSPDGEPWPRPEMTRSSSCET